VPTATETGPVRSRPRRQCKNPTKPKTTHTRWTRPGGLHSTLVARYGYSADGDTPDYTDTSGAVTERTISILGGVLVTKRTSGGDVWSYPNIHGDVIATTDNTGTKQGATLTYDPYGQPLAGVPDNSAGDLDYGWLGSNQRPLEHTAGIATIEMGARQYAPSLGRFLQVDPVEGGSANTYDYVSGDPLNSFDFTGTAQRGKKNIRHSAEELERAHRVLRDPTASRTAKNRAKEILKEQEKAEHDRRSRQSKDKKKGGNTSKFATIGAVGVTIWWIGKAAAPACGPFAPACALAL
jgi:RHS repeat-associated protein